jgi:hypothetical protein
MRLAEAGDRGVGGVVEKPRKPIDQPASRHKSSCFVRRDVVGCTQAKRGLK